MRNQLFAAALISLLASGNVFAADCGEVPSVTPTVPSGSTATSGDIRAARDAVVAFSNKVDEYLACMDRRAASILPYLSKEQKERWDEDLANLHETRRDLQTQMNQAIRDYRRAN
jgi:t-SNARE complex subunit (syntaxin)